MLTQSFLRTISEIAQLSLALPVVAMLFKFKKFNLLFWALGVLLLISTIIAFSGYILYANGTNNMPLLHIFTILEYACWSLFYYQLFRKKWQKRGILYLLVIFIICALVNSFYWQPFTTYNSFSRSIEGALLLCFAIIWFYEVFVDGKIPKLETHPVFWINAGVLVYLRRNIVNTIHWHARNVFFGYCHCWFCINI